MARKAEGLNVRQVLLYQDEDGIWIAEVPSLPGCGSDGESRHVGTAVAADRLMHDHRSRVGGEQRAAVLGVVIGDDDLAGDPM